uniref:ras GTPase-activating protein-binding protein 1-like n=1 Tax=Styela clava TaxID=7725 RepID=UPI00193AC890|nr:ras GTPase-activating protein-binding protein 1-like [Styela clava]
MVRMDHPSPFQVGREFVRQYYSLLNKAPEILHRFYGVNSSYVHGSRYCNGEPEEEVVGQMAIHKKITSLQFKECHTKVYQVDAHATISNGVVVQVIGELSNNRKPLRRFMQTFVLAPQGDNPYKFYVHNDIFRYEDEVYQDEGRQEHLEEEQELDEEVNVQQPPPQPTQFDNHIGSQNQAAQIINNDLEPRLDSQPVTSDDQDSPALAISPPNHPESETESDHAQDTEPVDIEPRNESPVYPNSNENEEPQLEETAEKDIPEPTDNINSVPHKEPEPVQPYSWAALASKNTPAQHNIQQGTVVKVNQSNDGPSMDQQKQQVRSSRPPVTSQRDGSGEGMGDPGGRRQSRYPDNQQIFVGNLPLEITESDLREHFSEYGEIVEIRINHSNTSNPSFGFIIFEDHKAVEEVLRLMPTTFKNNKRINIEEKKQRAMSRDGGRRPGPGRWESGRDNNRGGRLQQRGPPRRDWGGSREGQRPNNFPGRR